METIKLEIEKKKQSQPYYPDPQLIFQVKTDINEWPYQRYFRGKKDSDRPVVWEREAGYSPILTSINTKNQVNENTLFANCCFQIPCSTILPCNPKSQDDLKNNKKCVIISP